MRTPKEIILHIIDSDNPKHDNIETIRSWHTSPPRNWSDVGYHFYITSKGERQPGRPLKITGAHTLGHNRDTIGVSTFGKFGTERTQKQYQGIIELIMDLKIQFPSIVSVKQHSDYDPVNRAHCAGFNGSQMEYLNTLVQPSWITY